MKTRGRPGRRRRNETRRARDDVREEVAVGQAERERVGRAVGEAADCDARRIDVQAREHDSRARLRNTTSSPNVRSRRPTWCRASLGRGRRRPPRRPPMRRRMPAPFCVAPWRKRAAGRAPTGRRGRNRNDAVRAPPARPHPAGLQGGLHAGARARSSAGLSVAWDRA